MRAHRIEQRLEDLEKRYRDRLRPPQRVFECVVRKGHESKDQETAFRALGMHPTDDDLTICMVGVSAQSSASRVQIEPSARLVAG